MSQMQREPERQQDYTRRYFEPEPVVSISAREQRERDNRQREREAQLRKSEEIEKQKLLDLAIQRNVIEIRRLWGIWQRNRYDLPPELLALEAERDFEDFKSSLPKADRERFYDAAFNRIGDEVAKFSLVAHKAFENFTKEMQGLQRLSFLSFEPLRSLLRGLTYSLAPPRLAPPGDSALASAQKIMRSQWNKDHPRSDQSSISFHKSGGKTYLQVGSGSHGFIYITVPASIAPEEMASRLLNKISGAVNKFVSSSSVIAFYDGDYQSMNPKQIFQKHRVIRSKADSSGVFLERVSRLLVAGPPVAADSTLHLGIPANRNELSAVFGTSTESAPDWDIWEGVHENWRSRAVRNGFAATADESTAGLECIVYDF
jgi:hypothetical protein